jgi:hypothetical protein
MAKAGVCGTEVDEQRAARKSEYEGRSNDSLPAALRDRAGALRRPAMAHRGATRQQTVQPADGTTG